ncbi:YycH family regulatory protein [Peribacillus frigoritolerans]|uniref:YycH family regulatory protein n=1 Tax=Peribacillus frigoritolerans TaxID=450367 RepID=UPI001404BF04|nr:two-component system activity regulator YycH [Peribacillus frigoritolerans]
MKREQAKTVILVLLVCCSVFFTYNLWTFKPNYDFIQNSQYLENAPISQVKNEPANVIRPYQMFVHQNAEHYGTFKAENIDFLWNQLRNWNISEVKNVSSRYTSDQLDEWLNGKSESKKIEFVFSDKIPFEIFQSIFQYKSQKTIYSSFDRIVLPQAKANQPQKIIFVSVEQRLVYEASISNENARTIIASIIEKKENLDPYISIDFSEDKNLLLPEGKIELNQMKYIINSISGEDFKQALFTNPSYVRREMKPTQNVYTDGTSLLTVYPSQERLRFVNPTIDPSMFIERGKAMKQSIEFLNNHGGWTDDYQFFNMDSDSQLVSFRLMVDSVPVFENNTNTFGPTEISMRWGNNEIATYLRPLYDLDAEFVPNAVKMPNGKEVINLLEQRKTIEKENVKRVFPAYEMSATAEPRIVAVKPYWYVETESGQFVKLQAGNDTLGGNSDGLE